jgi:hypothetical protein
MPPLELNVPPHFEDQKPFQRHKNMALEFTAWNILQRYKESSYYAGPTKTSVSI